MNSKSGNTAASSEGTICGFGIKTLGTELLQASLLVLLRLSKLDFTAELLSFEPFNKLDGDVIGSTVFDFFV